MKNPTPQRLSYLNMERALQIFGTLLLLKFNNLEKAQQDEVRSYLRGLNGLAMRTLLLPQTLDNISSMYQKAPNVSLWLEDLAFSFVAITCDDEVTLPQLCRNIADGLNPIGNPDFHMGFIDVEHTSLYGVELWKSPYGEPKPKKRLISRIFDSLREPISFETIAANALYHNRVLIMISLYMLVREQAPITAITKDTTQ